MVRKSLKKLFFQEFKKIYLYNRVFNFLKLRGESSGNFKEISLKEGVGESISLKLACIT